ncbi:MAG: hypothetical protein HC859_16440 [Bacteroidia bacterium]|nr:hypothetical protein [Bacteroidia bacterium]
MRSFALSLCLMMLLVCCKAQHDFSHDTFEIGVSSGILDNREINEASGLAASIRNEGMLWTHNDSGGQPWLFLIDKQAHYRATLKLPVSNRDWEDIAVARALAKRRIST